MWERDSEPALPLNRVGHKVDKRMGEPDRLSGLQACWLVSIVGYVVS